MEKTEFNYKLFPSFEAQEKFYNILAKFLVAKNHQSEESYKDELKDLIKNCGETLTNNGTTNLVEDIITLNAEINGTGKDGTPEELASKKEERFKLMESLSSIISKLESSHETMVEGEDLERDSNKAFNRQEKIFLLSKVNQEVSEKFPNHSSVTNADIKNSYPFKELISILGITPTIKDEDLAEVIKISEAPEEIKEDIKTEVNGPSSEISKDLESPVLSNNSFFASDSEIGKELSGLTENDELSDAQDETVAPLVEAPVDEIKLEEPEIKPIEPSETSVKEEPPLMEEAAMDDLLDEDASVLTYTMQSNEPLTALTKIAYESDPLYDPDTAYLTLYEKNKDIIDKRLQEKGLTLEEAKDLEGVLTGLTLKIPIALSSQKTEAEAIKKVA
ncbi:MAG: hypothetical protein Q4C44_04465 [bacterium]|nr:hypothetical protein [bacterium]